MYLIWALINAAYVIFFFGLVLALFTKGKELFNNKYGNAIIVVFVLGVMGMLGAKEGDFDNTYLFHGAKDIKGHHVKMMSATLEENFPFDILLSVSFKENETGKLVPSSSHANINGFVSGYQWEYKYADIDALENGSFSYKVNGLMHWHLFGINVYSQSKTFSGVLE